MRVLLFRISLAATLLATVALAAACRGGASDNTRQSNAAAQSSPSQSNAGPVTSTEDVAKLSEDIERLEKAAERNPGDEETRDELARAYVRRGNAQRAAGRPQEALDDYQRALRHDPDNDEAQKNAADIREQLGGEQEDENGAPLPPPITPNVSDEDGKPAATPKKQ